MTQIQDLRLSFIWAETFLDVLRDPTTDVPFCFLGSRPLYAAIFRRVLLGRKYRALGPPWSQPSGDYFWTYYLEGRTPGDLTGVQAWKGLVPFRTDVPVEVVAPWFQPGRLTLEGYFYPHGIALVITAVNRTPLALRQVVERAFQVRRIGRFNVSDDAHEASEAVSLDALALRGLRSLRVQAFGTSASTGSR